MNVVTQNRCVREYTPQTEKRLTAKLREFLGSIANGRAVFVTLTTREFDPAVAKRLLRRWVAGVRYHYDVHGVYCLEFNESHQVHYHLVLALGGELATKPTEIVEKKFWKIWKALGDHDSQAFKVMPANLKDSDWLVRYMAKSADEYGEPHPKLWQKGLPAAFEARGTKSHWWGVVGRSVTPQTQFTPPLDDKIDEVVFPLVKNAEVAA